VEVVEKQLSNPDSPFNPEYKKEKKFTRKSNRKKIIIIIVIVFLFLYGSLDYMNKTLTKIEIKTISGNRVRNPQFNDGECHIFITNKSPYNIVLIIPDNIETSYNNSELLSGVEYYYWFKSNSTKVLEVIGVKS
jgi:hypothetical protein